MTDVRSATGPTRPPGAGRQPTPAAGPTEVATQRALALAVGDATGLDTPARPDAVAGTGPVDWSGFATLASRHSVAALVRRSSWLATQPVPSAVDTRLHGAARRCTAAGLRDLTALGRIVAGAERAGLDVLVLRGLPLAGWAYGDPLARQSAEVHLHVAPAAVGETVRLLHRLGFDPLGPGPDDAPPDTAGLTLMGAQTFVDLHWRLFANPALLTLDLGDPRNRLCVDLGGLRVTTLAREPTWWYLATLGTLRRWRSLKWVADVPAMLAACPALVAPDALDRAAAAGVDRCVATALRLAEIVLGLRLDGPTRAWVAARSGVDRLVGQSRRYLAATGGDDGRPPAPLLARAAYDLSMRADARYRGLAVAGAVRRCGLSNWDPGPLRWDRVRSAGPAPPG